MRHIRLFFKDEKEERQIAISFSDYFGDFDVRTSNFSLILRILQAIKTSISDGKDTQNFAIYTPPGDYIFFNNKNINFFRTVDKNMHGTDHLID